MTVDHLAVVREESARFGALARALDPAAPVPSCPDWSAADLVWHLAEVQHFWASIVEGLLEDPDEVDDLRRPADAELADLFDTQSARLAAALADRDPGDACWTWSDDRTVGFVRRRQAHEAAIHRIDAELAGAAPLTPLDPDLAADGIGELLEHMVGGLPDWATFSPEGTFVRLVDETGRSWTVEFGRFRGTSPTTGTEHDFDDVKATDHDGPVDLTISGTADAIDRWLWGRGDLLALDRDGEQPLATRLRVVFADSMQ